MKFLQRKGHTRLGRFLAPLLFIVVLVVWYGITLFPLVPTYFLPPPGSLIESLRTLIADEGYLQDVGISIYRVLSAFAFSALIGVPLGVVAGINKYVDDLVAPAVDFIRHMPVAGFIPLSILWIGISDIQKITLLFIGTFFQLVPMVMDATKRIPEEFIDTARTLGARDAQIIRRVVVPWSLPGIYDSLRISLGITWTYLVVAEIVAASFGIGHVIIQAQRYLKTDYIFIGILTVGLLGLLSDTLFKKSYSRLFPWSIPNNNSTAE